MVTDMRISEDKVIKIFEKALNHARNLNASWNILIIIWHEIVLRMRGGRTYPQIRLKKLFKLYVFIFHSEEN